MVVVAERGSRGPAQIIHTGLGSDVAKGSISVVAVEMIGSQTGHVQIFQTISVEIR